MSAKKLLSLWGLKWNPFTPELPGDAMLVTPKIDSFAWRVEQLVQDGGFALISGESGTGKSVALRIVAQRRIQLTRSQAERFYAVHAERSFYNDLCNYMISGPVVPQVLEGENAIARNREIMGATNPTAADPGTIRADFGESVEANSTHGSDAPETAAVEIAFFFSDIDIVG